MKWVNFDKVNNDELLKCGQIEKKFWGNLEKFL